MFTYQNPKLSQYTGQQIFNQDQERVAKTNTKGQVISQKKRKYTQANLALQHGVSRQTISKIISWENKEYSFPKLQSIIATEALLTGTKKSINNDQNESKSP